MKDYGVEVYKHGVVFHGDGRMRRVGPLGWRHIERPPESRSHYRGVIRAFMPGDLCWGAFGDGGWM
jgi:hypothetical protein